MAHPRRLTKTSTYHITRRVRLRQLLLAPDPFVNNAFLFCLGVARQKFGVLVHSFIAMSNHYHIVTTDSNVDLPRFQAWLNRELANVLIAYRKCGGPLWQPGSYDAVMVREGEGLEIPLITVAAAPDGLLGDGEDIERAMDYGFLNAVHAGLVSTRSAWPGCWSTYRNLADGTVFRATRPELHFSEDSLAGIPEQVEFRLDPPPHWAALTLSELKRECRAAEQRLDRSEREIRAERQKKGRGFVGVDRVLAQDPFAFPETREKKGEVNPHVAGANRLVRMARILVLQVFRSRYRKCLDWIRKYPGSRVSFPCGTYWQRAFFGRDVDRAEFCVDPFPVSATQPP